MNVQYDTLVWDNGYEKRVYDVPTPQASEKVCQKILTDLWLDGVLPIDVEPLPKYPEILKVTDDDLGLMSDVARQSVEEAQRTARLEFENKMSLWSKHNLKTIQEMVLLSRYIDKEDEIDPELLKAVREISDCDYHGRDYLEMVDGIGYHYFEWTNRIEVV